MAALKVRNLWTAFVTAFFALLASVGLTTATATAATPQPAVATPDEPARAGVRTTGTGVPEQIRRAVPQRLPAARGSRSLPPTMKQRIGAEAHGASPATRRLRDREAEAAAAAETEGRAATVAAAAPAPVAAAVPQRTRRAARLAGSPDLTTAPAAAPSVPAATASSAAATRPAASVPSSGSAASPASASPASASSASASRTAASSASASPASASSARAASGSSAPAGTRDAYTVAA
ncbi:DUF6344 domain-containing protein [Streptomyces zhihengii]